MNRSVEITGKYDGERFTFGEPGSRVVIGSIRPDADSKQRAGDAGCDDTYTVTVKGPAEQDELIRNRTYRFYGRFRSYFNRRLGRDEMQFHFTSHIEHVPHDREGIAEYLAGAGRGHLIGPARARQLVDVFGIDDVLRVCRTDPQAVSETLNITMDHAQAFAQKLIEQSATENAMLEVQQLFKGRGFPKTLARKVIKRWGNQAAGIIHDDPYRMMEFRGVGFRLADKLYLSLKKDPRAIYRQTLCIAHAMQSDGDGHTWHRASKCHSHLIAAVGSAADPTAAIQEGIRLGKVDPTNYGAIAGVRTRRPDGPIADDGDTLWLAPCRHAQNERFIASALLDAAGETQEYKATRFERTENVETMVLRHAICARCNRHLRANDVWVVDGQPYGPRCIEYIDNAGDARRWDLQEWLQANPIVWRYITEQPSGTIRFPSVSLWPDVDELEIRLGDRNVISEHQREQAALAMSSRVGILAGSPGTGKTTLVAAIIRALHRSGRVGLSEIIVGAPTGKAAVRLTESLAAQGVPIRARTWHSHLGVAMSDEDTDTDGWTFAHGVNNPWDAKVIIGDEWSMPDSNIAASVFAARGNGAHMLLVGDTNQLPPVGAGAPFRDIIESGTVGYGELRKIERNSGGIVEACAKIRDQKDWTDEIGEGSNLVLSHSRTPEQQVDYIIDNIHRAAAEDGIDPVWDVQVICAVNKSDKLSKASLNQQLQQVLNPNAAVEGTPFRVGDKVVCLKNSWARPTEPIDPARTDCLVKPSGEVYVANGELGKVEGIEKGSMIVSLENPDRTIRIFYGKAKANDKDDAVSVGCNWDLGYALSCHKYQGSEQKVVFVVLDTSGGARMVCDRSWLYTAISRAKVVCHLVGMPQTATGFCSHQKITGRQTMLRRFILAEQLEREIASYEL